MLRTTAFPLGVPEMSHVDPIKTNAANELYMRMGIFLEWLIERGVAWVVENPAMAQTGKYCLDALNYKNFGRNAAWPMTQISHETYLNLDAQNLSPWTIVDGWKIETVGFDLLHNLFLGTARDLIASGIQTLILNGVYHQLAGQDLDTILDYIHREMHQSCAEHGFLTLKNNKVFGPPNSENFETT